MISAIIPTLNEEQNIEAAIRSVSFADEILVIDSYSSDNTVSAAERMGAKVIQREFDDFSSQKNYAIEQARHEWILAVDADERVSKELAAEIQKAAQEPEEMIAFFLYRNSYFKGKLLRYGGWQTDKAIRLFKKSESRYNGNLVHETITTRGPVGFLKNRLDHYSYRSQQQYQAKLEMYANLQAQQLFGEKKKLGLWLSWIKPGFRFFVHYFVRLGFLDGRAGFELARIHSYGVWKRYVFLKRLYREPEASNLYVKQRL